MEEYGKILVFVMPVFLILIIIEKTYGHYKGENTSPNMDSVSSVSSGMVNSVKDVLGLSITLISYDWIVSKIALFHLEATTLAYLIGFIAIDFYGYWSHRFSHQINFLWNKHAIHHSSEEFNLACALRQPISSFVNLFTFLLIPAALFGVPSKVIAVTLPIHLFLQFWYHTKHIKKIGFLENILVSPSHHRVHHAINPEYMDKNHSQIFIIWDKLFGTFQEELETVPPVFGITRPAQTWNPIRINFQHLWLMITDAWRAENWKDKFAIWFKPTGWRPENFEEKYPVHKIKNVYDFEKYGTQHSKKLMIWSMVQAIITLLFISYLYNSIAIIGLPNVFIYGAFIFVTVYSYTELMDARKISILWEILRFAFGIAIIAYLGDWFSMNQLFPLANYIIIGYLTLSLIATIYFVSVNFEKEKVALA
ncbi:sterol desaturase family protein [Flavobacterium gawalongense]|uniref:Sterol desaturase family protein n=1 Tax=Flavobacterium gawalongense TaxID=2594432 RepID=A0A553BST1_9FLAO|nr:sterol desaturase family protein [Flavobacterium gawalongense]TRX03668.1 sterol desaturase family protein [Flavobacterium gawalongense]TRX08815.1 sterol desaturase family protein [Flavobacterium gawalongense]TRX11306.1 sterol desaturase family protein [Flavobacterium gawalongense]TRX12233.1 sterol desaturase family protein [Flavobacterium gawalongense]TRX30228.1 sterol desaturase family protein [Flavobacterium gawalongense]